jgi:hypothetical protein
MCSLFRGHDTAGEADDMDATTSSAVVVTHRVADYIKWRPAFDEGEAARRAAGLTGHHVNQSADDANLVAIYLTAPSQDVLRRFAAAPSLAEGMARAGVVGAPEILPLEPIEDRILKRDLPACLLIHEVADYTEWKLAFDEHAAARRRAGIIGHAVNRRADAPHVVVLYLQAETLEALRAFSRDPELAATMKRAGVIGAPTFRFVEGRGWKAYQEGGAA